MHFNFDFSTVQILWTITFAALLVLLVVLLGRDRARNYPWFTISIALMALDKLAARLLYRRMSQVLTEEIFLTLADLAAIVAVLVAIEIARRAFQGADRKMWIAGTLALLAVGGVVLVLWGPWPSTKTLMGGSELSTLRLMDLFAQKTNLLANLLFVQLGLLVMVFGSKFKAGWHSHTQQLSIGLFMAALSQLVIRGTLQHVATQITIRSQDDYKRVVAMINSLNTAGSIILIVVLLWWIVCLWNDESGTKTAVVSGQ
jgi:hypothetical protein